MADSWRSRLYVALVHHPVVDKRGEVIAASVTNLDLHDIARAVCTYGAAGYGVITPLEDQVAMIQRIRDHWVRGMGGRYNPMRREALERVTVHASFDALLEEIATAEGVWPKSVATTARRHSCHLTCRRLRSMLRTPTPFVLVFGTAWGLAPSFIKSADYVLEPLAADRPYNHLSVRSAAAILLDRLLGRRRIQNIT